MWKFEFCENDVKRVLGAGWTLGGVRVAWAVSLSMDMSYDFVEQLLRRHLHLHVGELHSESYELDAIAEERAKGRTFCTRYLCNGVVYVVTTDPAKSMTEVTQAFEDEIEKMTFETSFQKLLLERGYSKC